MVIIFSFLKKCQMAHPTGLSGSNFISESKYKFLEMKKWILHTIYTLFCFLLAYIFPGRAKNSNKIGKCTPAPVKAAFMPIKLCFIIASTEKTLWRHTVFRCGTSALIILIKGVSVLIKILPPAHPASMEI
jgi:hypothetical protein